MKLNSTVALTLILLTLMFGAGVVSAAWGFALGSQALKGITQPDTRPTNKVANRKNAGNRSEEVVVLREEDILTRVKERMGMPAREPIPSISPTKKPDAANQPSSDKLKMVSQTQGVTLEVMGIRRQTGSLIMDVTLQNASSQPVQFRYRFLNVFDDRGNVINADTAGLPEELPARSVKFTGTITIAEPLVSGAEKLSMQLSDYPDQKLQLQMSDILVK
jgi:hypothetical protein